MVLYRFGDFAADAGRFELTRLGRPVAVQRIALETLFYLLKMRERLVTKSDLIRGPWRGSRVSDSAVSRAVMLARRAIEDPEGRIIVTIHGVGYRLTVPVSVLDQCPGSDDSVLHSSPSAPAPDAENGANSRVIRPQLRALQDALTRASEGPHQLRISSPDVDHGKEIVLAHFKSWLELEGAVFLYSPMPGVANDEVGCGEELALWAVYGPATRGNAPL